MKREIVLSFPGSVKSETQHVEQYNYALGYVDQSDIHFRSPKNTNQLLYASIKDVLIDSKKDLWSTVSKQELNREIVHIQFSGYRTYLPRYQLLRINWCCLNKLHYRVGIFDFGQRKAFMVSKERVYIDLKYSTDR